MNLAERKTPEDRIKDAAAQKERIQEGVALKKQEGEERYKLSRPDLFPQEHQELQSRAQQIRDLHAGKGSGTSEIKAPKMEELLEAIKTNTNEIGANK